MTSKLFTPTKEESTQFKSPSPLLSVWGWEIRRVFENPLNWAFTLASFLFFLAMMWFKHAWNMGTDTGSQFTLYGTSAIGLLYEFTVVLMFVFAFMLPFVVTEGIARDYKKRMHEVIMATSLSTPAYVWGRFLAVLSIAFGQALLMLLAGLVMGSILHLRNDAYPQPLLSNLIIVWALIVIPPMILITGIGFSLGTFWPRRTRLIMLGILIAWILLFTLGSILRLNPTGSSIVVSIIPQLMQKANASLASLPLDQRAAWVQQLQANLPDVGGWIIPQYGLAAAGILLVGITTAGFRRFRNELN